MTKNKTIVVAEPDKQEYFITREFDAPREMVFKAFTDSGLFAQWGLGGNKIEIEDWNYKTGGSYRYVMLGMHANFGVIHEVFTPERIIRTFEFSGLPEKGHTALEKILFTELSEKRTRVAIQFICESVTFRDGMAGAGMEKNLTDAYDTLDEFLAKGLLK